MHPPLTPGIRSQIQGTAIENGFIYNELLLGRISTHRFNEMKQGRLILTAGCNQRLIDALEGVSMTHLEFRGYSDNDMGFSTNHTCESLKIFQPRKKITVRGLEKIRGLKSLWFHDCKSIFGIDWSQLSKSTLQSICFMGGIWKASEIESLRGIELLPELKQLQFRWAKVKDESYESLTKCRSLQYCYLGVQDWRKVSGVIPENDIFSFDRPQQEILGFKENA